MTAYAYDEIVDAYCRLGVGPGRVIYVTSDVGRLMAFEKPGKDAILEAHFEALMNLLGPEGTLVVPTACVSLCNSDIPFDVEKTPSEKIGIFSEFVRRKKGALRSFHPFVSYAAIGKRASEITQNVSRHAYGHDTPEGRLVEADALSVSIGLYPNWTCSTSHQVEQMMSVPYRYTKEYLHPVVRDGEIVREPFYQYVLYLSSDADRSACKRIFARYVKDHEIAQAAVGRGHIYSYPMREFVAATVEMFKDDIYIWCKATPIIRPWQK